MLNVIQPGSYIRPHRHLDPPKDESLIVLRGLLVVIIFEQDGEISGVHRLGGDDAIGIDLEAGVIHTFLAEAPDTVVFEVKPGPYLPATDKDFMSWAPQEGSPEVGAFLDGLSRRVRGARLSRSHP
jgi:cupin fold WbuC family metalloprotein